MLPQLIVLPGLDGTGNLLQGLKTATAAKMRTKVLSLPEAGPQDYATLERSIRRKLPKDGSPYMIVAESFSGPLAIRISAEKSPGLQAIALVNSYVESPLSMGKGVLGTLALPLWLQVRKVPRRAVRHLMLGADAPKNLVEEVSTAIERMRPGLLAARWKTVLTANEAAAYVKSQIPMFYLRGMQDKVVPETALETLIRVRPGLQLHEMKGPHMLLQRYPERCAEVIQKWASERG